MRKLILIKAYHNKIDMKRTPLKNIFTEKGWQIIEAYWDIAEKKLMDMRLTWGSLKIYCESNYLPQDIFLPALIKRSDEGSRHSRIVLWMINRGAELVETENKAHFEGNYCDIVKRSKERDEYIARRINATLKDFETGVLIIGAKHRVEQYLPEDIKVESLLDIEDTPELKRLLMACGLLSDE